MSSSDVSVVPDHGLQIGDEVRPLVSGAVHYWRIPPERWPAVLDAVAELGVTIVETYVPWSVHERDGRMDFSGSRDVQGFLRAVEERGMLAIVRPGPHINAELGDFGFPQRVLWNPLNQALGPLGTPVVQHSRASYFPCPSYSSSSFLRDVRGWYDAILPRLAPLQWPDGPIVATQVDNEMGYFFFTDPFVMDYHPEAVSAWHEWSGRGDAPPTDGADDALLVDSWVRFKEVSRLAALRTLADWLRDAGIRTPLFHNDFPALTSPVDQARLEASGVVDIAATDLYVTRENLVDALTAGRTLCGSSRLPYVAELGAGWVADVVGIPQRIAPRDEDAAMLALLLTGVRAWNWYMLVEREHWYGSPIDRHGHVRRKEAELYRKVATLLPRIDWWSLRRDAPVLLLRDRDLDRRHVGRRTACEVNPVLDPLQFPAGLREVQRDDQESFLDEWRRALELAGLDFDEGSSDAPPAWIDRYRMVICMTGARINSVVSTRPGTVPLPSPPYQWSAPAEVSLHRFTGPREVLGVVNRRATPCDVHISGLGAAHLRPLWHPADAVTAHQGSVILSVPEYGGQMWEVVR